MRPKQHYELRVGGNMLLVKCETPREIEELIIKGTEKALERGVHLMHGLNIGSQVLGVVYPD
jgi:hypothetical protein